MENSDFLAPAGEGDAELGTVFGDGAPGDLVSAFCHFGYKLFVRERFLLVLAVDAFLEHFLELPCRDLVSLAVLHSFGEEVLKREDPEMGFDVLAVHDAAYR